MRPVDQIVDDIAKVQEQLNTLEAKKKILVEELTKVHDYASSALSGIN